MLKLDNIPVNNTLKPFVRKITIFRGNCKKVFIQRILPSMYPCLSFNRKNIPAFKNHMLIQQPKERLQIIGPKTNTGIIVEHFGEIEQIIIEFSAIGFMALLGKSPTHYCNKLFCFNALSKQKHLIEKLSTTNGLGVSATVLQQHLETLIPENVKIDERIITSIKTIETNKKPITVQELCSRAKMNERHFNRTFKTITGVSPKMYAKIHQLHQIINHMAKHQQPMIDIALNNGFFDQSHFNRRFRNLVNLSPSEFLRSNEHVSLAYFST